MSFAHSFGCHVFTDNVMKNMLDANTFESLRRTRKEGRPLDESIAEQVAAAMLKWAVEQGATHYVHWFQPMTDSAAGKSEGFLEPCSDGTAVLSFSSRALVQGEPDASSFPSGGLRNTFEARGYTAWDPTSSVFVRDKTLFIPTCFCGPGGESLDYKTPLLRSMDAVSKSTVNLLRLLGDNETQRVIPQVGAEQEYFLIDRGMYERRLDLKICGRTLIGAPPPKTQELDDHYYGRVKIRVAAFMQELDQTLWELGVVAKTKHNEVAPTQHELAVVYDSASLTCDGNQLVMETMKTVAKRHNLACLLHEKPFARVNGSGKHNNYSLATDGGKNLLSPGKAPENNLTFMLLMAAFVRGIDIYGAQLRLTTATPNNDFRLGGFEAPPAIISMFLGSPLEQLLTQCAGDKAMSQRGTITTGVNSNPEMLSDDADRNRTSPFAFTGNKFEFRMVGSSQSIGLVNTVLNAIVADSLDYITGKLSGSHSIEADARVLVRDIMKQHGRIIFNGDNYSTQWTEEAKLRGIPSISNALDAIEVWRSPETAELLSRLSILSPRECASRYEVMMENYRKIIIIEASTMLEIVKRQIIPTVINCARNNAEALNSLRMVGVLNSTLISQVQKLSAAISELTELSEALREHISAVPNGSISVQNHYIRDVIRVDMSTLRAISDEVERAIASADWPMPTYTDLMHRV